MTSGWIPPYQMNNTQPKRLTSYGQPLRREDNVEQENARVDGENGCFCKLPEPEAPATALANYDNMSAVRHHQIMFVDGVFREDLID